MDSARSRKSEEGTTTRHFYHSQDPIYQNEGNNDCDNNYSALGSEDSILPDNYEQTKNYPIGKILLDIAHVQTMLTKKCKFENMSVNIHEICENFEKFMDIGEKHRQKHSEQMQDEMEQRLIRKKIK
jgi:hypothetical protein